MKNVINEEQVCSIRNEPPSYMDPIIMYLLHGDLPENKNEARICKSEQSDMP